jgi:hypothetical protein
VLLLAAGLFQARLLVLFGRERARFEQLIGPCGVALRLFECGAGECHLGIGRALGGLGRLEPRLGAGERARVQGHGLDVGQHGTRLDLVAFVQLDPQQAPGRRRRHHVALADTGLALFVDGHLERASRHRGRLHQQRVGAECQVDHGEQGEAAQRHQRPATNALGIRLLHSRSFMAVTRSSRSRRRRTTRPETSAAAEITPNA